MLVLHTVGFTLLFAAVYYLPGRLLTDLLPGKLRREDVLPLALALGLVTVNTTAILVAGLAEMAAGWLLSAPLLAAAAALVAATAAWLRRRRPDNERLPWLVRPGRRQVGLWVLTAAATSFFLLLYDQDLIDEDTCKVRAATPLVFDYARPDLMRLVAGDPAVGAPDDENELLLQDARSSFLLRHYDQRLGPSVLLAPFLALFGTFGFRLTYALQGLLLPGLGYLLGRQVLGRGWPAWTTAVALTFSPYALELRTFDENILACCFGSLALVLLLRSPAAPGFAGVAMSLFLGIRHVGILLLPLVALYLRRATPAPGKAIARFALGTAVFGAPYLILHASMLVNDGILFEGAADAVAVPHSLAGFDFTLPVFLNFPFVPQPLRSPYGVHAPLLAIPLDLLSRSGWLAAALVPAGVAHLLRINRPRALLLASWFAVFLSVLLIQSNWTEPNKMGIPASVLAPAVLAVVAGGVHLVRTRSNSTRLGWIALGLALPLAIPPLAGMWEPPLDDRMFEIELDPEDKDDYRQHAGTQTKALRPDESPPYLAWERAASRPGPLPRMRLRQFHPVLLRLRANQLAANLRQPRVKDYSRPLPTAMNVAMLGPGKYTLPISLWNAAEREPAAPRLAQVQLFEPSRAPADVSHREMLLDLSTPPSLADAPLGPIPSDDPRLVLELDRGYALLVEGLGLAFDHRPVNLFAARDHRGTVFLMLLPGEVGTAGAPDELALMRIDGARYGEGAVPLRLPTSTAIRILDVRNYHPRTPAPGHPRVYVRNAVVGDEGIWLSRAVATSVF